MRCGSTRARFGFTHLPARYAGGDGLSNVTADLERVLEVLQQAAVDAEKIGAVSVEVTLTDPFGAGLLISFFGESSEIEPEEPNWH